MCVYVKRCLWSFWFMILCQCVCVCLFVMVTLVRVLSHIGVWEVNIWLEKWERKRKWEEEKAVECLLCFSFPDRCWANRWGLLLLLLFTVTRKHTHSRVSVCACLIPLKRVFGHNRVGPFFSRSLLLSFSFLPGPCSHVLCWPMQISTWIETSIIHAYAGSFFVCLWSNLFIISVASTSAVLSAAFNAMF